MADCCCSPFGPPGGGAVAPLSQAVYVSKAAAGGGDGSIAKPFNTLQAAADALPTGGVVLVAPGDYSAETVAWADDVPISWNSLGPLLGSAQGTSVDPNSPQFPPFTLTVSGNPGAPQSFQGLRMTGLATFGGGNVTYFHGCTGVNVAGAVVLFVLGGQLVESDIGNTTLFCQGVDIFNATMRAASFIYLLGCQSWGQGISVEFPAGPPGPTLFFDTTTKGNASNQTPNVTNGVGLFSGLPLQSITGATTDDVVNSIVSAGVALGLWEDNR